MFTVRITVRWSLKLISEHDAATIAGRRETVKECEFRMIEDRNRTPGAVVEKDGVHFGFYGSGQERPVLLLYKKG